MPKYRTDGEKPKPVQSSFATKALRGLLPLPLPAAQMVASSITGDTKLGFGDVDDKVKDEVALSVINARNRTGSNRGGTEYIDYSEEIDKDINSLDVGVKGAVLGSTMSPDFRAATTFGRVSYKYDPNTDTYYVYDSYDFSETPRKQSAYSNVRAAAGKVGPTDGEANLIGTFKGSDYRDRESEKSYGKLKKFEFPPMPKVRMEFKGGGKVKYRSKVNEAGNYTKPGMRKRLFEKIKAGGKGGDPGEWSARKAQMLAKEYKAKGGGYK